MLKHVLVFNYDKLLYFKTKTLFILKQEFTTLALKKMLKIEPEDNNTPTHNQGINVLYILYICY